MSVLLLNRSGRQLSVLGAVGAVVSLLLVGPARATLTAGSQDVSGWAETPEYSHNGQGYGPFAWSYGYAITFDGSKVEQKVRINFEFDQNIPLGAHEQERWKMDAAVGIEEIWSLQYAVRDNRTGATYPVVVDVALDGPFDQTVQVHVPDGTDDRTTMRNWHVTDTPQIQAHEFGHMLGLYDQYRGGAIGPSLNLGIDNDSLMGMGALTANPTTPDRYYQTFVDFVNDLNPTGDFSLTADFDLMDYAEALDASALMDESDGFDGLRQMDGSTRGLDSNLAVVPEPGTLLLLAVGGLAVMRRRR